MCIETTKRPVTPRTVPHVQSSRSHVDRGIVPSNENNANRAQDPGFVDKDAVAGNRCVPAEAAVARDLDSKVENLVLDSCDLKWIKGETPGDRVQAAEAEPRTT